MRALLRQRRHGTGDLAHGHGSQASETTCASDLLHSQSLAEQIVAGNAYREERPGARRCDRNRFESDSRIHDQCLPAWRHRPRRSFQKSIISPHVDDTRGA